MAIVEADWSIDRSTKIISYDGDDHGGASPSYATVIELHRWLQDLADDALASGDDELDITNINPSQRSTNNIITLINGYTLDETAGNATEHLYDGSIIMNGGDDVYDGFVNFGNLDVQVQIIQDGAVLADDWWNFASAGLNPNSAQGISHRFMLKTVDTGVDIDGRRVLGTCRRFGFTYSEFPVNGTSRGNNVLALSDANDLNNETIEGTVSGWTTIVNDNAGWIEIDVNDNGTPEEYYSEWNKAARSINDLYERAKWLTRDGSAETLYGISGELFRGITHEIIYSGLTGTFDEGNEISWSGASVGTGQVLADNGTDTVWVQLLTGVAPVGTASLSQSSPDAASATVSSVVDRSALVSTPFIGASTGSAIIGAYGVGFDLDTPTIVNTDTVFDLANSPWSPPTLTTNTVTGLVSGEDRVLVAPWDGVTTDVNGDQAITKDQMDLTTSLTTDPGTDFNVVVDSIPADTPSSGTIRLIDDNGFERRLVFLSWAGSTFLIDYSVSEADIPGVCDFSTVNATESNAAVTAYVSYVDKLADATTAAFQVTYASDRDLVVIVRDGGGTPIKQFISAWSITSSNQSIAVIRTTDE